MATRWYASQKTIGFSIHYEITFMAINKIYKKYNISLLDNYSQLTICTQRLAAKLRKQPWLSKTVYLIMVIWYPV